VILVVLATLFTGQHYIPDPIGGLLLAWFGYRVGLWCVAEPQLKQEALEFTLEN
jgi:membrane-associated phospholipid phosphatase